MAKRKVKVWGKMNLYETSVVGIPAYPDAHASVESFSLVKALSNSDFKPKAEFVEEKAPISETLNTMEEIKETMENQEKAIETVEIAKEVEVAKSETPVALGVNDIMKIVKESLKDSLKELDLERGVVEKQVTSKKSLGEMAMDKGLFVK